jgi:hypothetical protein
MVRLLGSLLVCLASGCAFLDRPTESDNASSLGELLLSPGRFGAVGVYGAGDTSPQGKGSGGEIGLIYNDAWWDAKLGFAGQYSAGSKAIFWGPTLAAHVQLPTRISPFVGVGLFGSLTEKGTGQFDENFQEISAPEYSAIYPEAGVNFWLCDYARLTTSASYHFTSAGREHDFWTVGASIALMFPWKPGN